MESVLENQAASVEESRHERERSSTRLVCLMKFILLVGAMTVVICPKLCLQLRFCG
jgi:hypothetical protein